MSIDTIKLADGSHVYEAIIDEDPVTARLNVKSLYNLDAAAVRSCQGKTADQAREILLNIGREEIDNLAFEGNFAEELAA
ncbi:hypothetical protein KBD59_04925 [Candidatus Gracilibacteria bacterium]|nr:hypothetical protein [Candidatus Gracilibacteria bacterium]